MQKTPIAIALSTLSILVSSNALSRDLSSAPDESIEKMSVVSSRFAQPEYRLATSITVLDEIDLRSQSTLSVADILRNTPSINVSNAGGLGKTTTLRIRGEESFRTKLYIDGVELTDPSAPQVSPIFDDVLAQQLSRIEILRGAQGLAYGADAGGIVTMYTKEPANGLSANATFSGSRYNTKGLSANLSLGNEQGGVLLAVSNLSSSGFNAQTTDLSGEKDSYDNDTTYIKGHYNIAENWQAKMVIRQVDAKNEYDGCFDNTTFAASNDCLTDSEQTTMRGSLAYKDEKSSHEVAFNTTDIERRFINNGEFGFINSGSVNKFEYIGSYAWQSQRFVFGAENKQENLDGENLSRHQKSIFAEWLGEFDQSTFFNLGIRHDDNDTFGGFDSVRIGAVKHVELGSLDLKLKTSYGAGFRAPSLYEQNYNDGPFAYGDAAGLQLEEENSKGLDVGFELTTPQGNMIEVVYFDQQVENEIIFDSIGFQGYLQVAGQSKSRGVEANFEYNFHNGLTFSSNYTHNNATDSRGELRLRRPRNKVNLGLKKALLNDTLFVELTHRSVSGAEDIGGQALESYSVTNLSAYWHLSENVSFKASLTNLLDNEYQEVLNYNSAGRALSVSTTISL
ncbi:TonB-dependent receptor [Aliiglaciecola sp. LCG003]|uniref:TonB-dependent receptor plug domain-containing protein n=1 Tax=Aliiglaciecola sp. LCG003 TaxID=3053655 RepID=UPI002573A3F7|nr:TonB-dependent receptor [Aliiglaciecola sp. LCG003]WJG08796.1 TonB-dependent receptor [Aliiglaciecola sp. LCG003]